MKALVFQHSLAREAAAKLTGQMAARGFLARYAPIGLEEAPEPVPPGPGWVLCETIVSGICGSDVTEVRLNGRRDNPLTALVSFPHVLGHEALARRTDTGERVVLDPWLGCVPRGIDPPCPACAAGRAPFCRNLTEGALPPALILGTCAGAGGAHAERFCAHESQLVGVPPGVGDDAAVLAEPACVALRSILKRPPDRDLPVLVYGSGTIALAAVGLLGHLHPKAEVWVACRPGPRAELALALGAHAVLPSRPEALVREVAGRRGARPYVPWSDKEWLMDGPGVVYDMVGSAESIETSLRLLATGGSLVVTGVEPPRRFEWTPLYFKELDVVGSNAFGVEEVRGVRKHAFEHYFDFVEAGLDLTSLITHRFPLGEWDTAFLTAMQRSRTGAVKVLLEPGGR